MNILSVIESRQWVHLTTGQIGSPYGACPWTSVADRANWALRCTGYTWYLSNGTVGLGRRPVATRAEAEEIMRAHNDRLDQRLRAMTMDLGGNVAPGPWNK